MSISPRANVAGFFVHYLSIMNNIELLAEQLNANHYGMGDSSLTFTEPKDKDGRPLYWWRGDLQGRENALYLQWTESSDTQRLQLMNCLAEQRQLLEELLAELTQLDIRLATHGFMRTAQQTGASTRSGQLEVAIRGWTTENISHATNAKLDELRCFISRALTAQTEFGTPSQS